MDLSSQDDRTAMIARNSSWISEEGTPSPLGVTWIPQEQAFNFAVFSEHAESVTLMLFNPDDLVHPSFTFLFDFLRNKSGPVWHCRIPAATIGAARYYAYSVAGPNPPGMFDPQKVLLDPYARCVFFPETFDRTLAMREGPNAGKAPLGVIAAAQPVAEHGALSSCAPHYESDAIIYELHVRGFTRHPSSGVDPSRAGTFDGLVEKIPYLKELGVTIVELMPVFQGDPQDGSYWGYMPLNFFSPQNSYASRRASCGQHQEFRSMVEAFHQAGLEVILDVIYNHTSERDHQGPIYSFKGLANSEYYMLTNNPANPYADYTGTGNTLNTTLPYVRQMILDSLRYWRVEMGIDGFRFDLASVFSRNADGSLNWQDPPIFEEICADPELSNSRLIAEPWDAAGAYQLGRSFRGISWMQWNGAFRDDIRRFVKGDPGMVPSLMRRLYGSDDFFPDDRLHAYHAYQSVNFVTSHDGFTLYDLVSYNEKRNWANGNENRDGMDQNYSWNCGSEGDDGLPAEVLALRRKQVKNFCCLLMLSNGTPMFRAGDEFMHTQRGNNNPYNQDNEISWLDWDRYRRNQDIFRFFQRMIALRKSHPSLCRSRFWRNDVRWHGADGLADTSYDSHSLAFFLSGASENDDDIYVMINSYWQKLAFKIPEGIPGDWARVVDTSLPSPDDVVDVATPLQSASYVVDERSVVILVRPKS
jgi:glycogen operon protein